MRFYSKIVSVLGLFISIALNSSCKADMKQNENREGFPEMDTTFCYTIGDYQVCPQSRLVKFGHMIGGVNWDGWGYSPDTTVNYDTTTLVFLGEYIDFIEHLKGIDFPTLKVLSDKSFQDNKGIYMLGHRKPDLIMSLEGKTKIRECLYQDEKGIYTLNATSGYPKLNLIEHLDFAVDTLNLQYIVDDFFIDKNGLYSFSWYPYSDGVVNTSKFGKKLQSFDKDALPKFEVHESYIIVNGVVYTRSDGCRKLDLKANDTKELLINTNYQTYLISDGTKAYCFSKHYQGRKFEEVTALRNIDYGNMLGWVGNLYFNEHTQSLYIGGDQLVYKGLTLVYNNAGFISIADDGSCFVLNSDLKITKYNNLYVYNATTKEFELADRTNFQILNNDIVYKDLLYTYYGHSIAPIVEVFDTKNIRKVGKSNFIEDGKKILYTGGTGGIRGSELGVYKEEYIAAQVDFGTLEVINPNTLMDKNNIYTVNGRLDVIPKSKLGINIKVYK